MIRQIPNSYFPVPNREKKRGREFGQLWIVVRKKEGVSALGTTVKLTGHGETKKKNGIQHLKNIVWKQDYSKVNNPRPSSCLSRCSQL